MDNAFYIKDDDYYPENNQGMKMSIVEEQVNQESFKQDEEEEDEKENNSNNDDVFQEEQRINNFSFGKHDKRLMEESSKNEETSNPINLYKKYKENYKNEQEEGEGEGEDLSENNLDGEYSTPNEEEGEIFDDDFDVLKNDDSLQKRYDSEKDSNDEFPNIINLFKNNTIQEKKNIENQKRILEITEAFNLFDKDCDGNIDIKELVTVMRTLGYDPNKEELDDIIKTFDVDKSGTIDKEEFINLLTTKMKEQKDDKDLLEIFNMFDKNRDGLISENDIYYIIEEIGEEFEEDIIKELINIGDEDKDGKINFIEFKKIFNSKRKK